jgi:hypothetical protein
MAAPVPEQAKYDEFYKQRGDILPMTSADIANRRPATGTTTAGWAKVKGIGLQDLYKLYLHSKGKANTPPWHLGQGAFHCVSVISFSSGSQWF